MKTRAKRFVSALLAGVLCLPQLFGVIFRQTSTGHNFIQYFIGLSLHKPKHHQSSQSFFFYGHRSAEVHLFGTTCHRYFIFQFDNHPLGRLQPDSLHTLDCIYILCQDGSGNFFYRHRTQHNTSRIRSDPGNRNQLPENRSFLFIEKAV